MNENENIVLLTADDESEELTIIREKFPTRTIMLGIAECNLVGVASGLTKLGLIPLVYTYGSFLAYRALEFIRCDVCINNLNVKIIGWGSGVKVNNYGPTHHTTEDISMLRVLPNMTIVSPASCYEVEPIVRSSIEHQGPVYIRLGKAFENEIFSNRPSFKIGFSSLFLEGEDITFISTGNIISNVINVSDRLLQEGIKSDVINISSLKPIDRLTIIESIMKTKKVITVEEHQVIGGLGSAVAEIIADEGLPCVFKRIGFNDKFATEYGWYKDIIEQNGLSVDSIYYAAKQMF